MTSTYVDSGSSHADSHFFLVSAQDARQAPPRPRGQPGSRLRRRRPLRGEEADYSQ